MTPGWQAVSYSLFSRTTTVLKSDQVGTGVGLEIFLGSDVRPDQLMFAVRRSVSWRRLVSWHDAEDIVLLPGSKFRAGHTVEVD
jgi:hypothetical protein